MINTGAEIRRTPMGIETFKEKKHKTPSFIRRTPMGIETLDRSKEDYLSALFEEPQWGLKLKNIQVF